MKVSFTALVLLASFSSLVTDAADAEAATTSKSKGFLSEHLASKTTATAHRSLRGLKGKPPPKPKITICHYQDDDGDGLFEFKELTLPEKAALAHLANHHNDTLLVKGASCDVTVVNGTNPSLNMTGPTSSHSSRSKKSARARPSLFDRYLQTFLPEVPPVCKVPKDTPNTLSWDYYSGLVNKNQLTAKLARGIEEYKGAKSKAMAGTAGSEEGEEAVIPHRLLFTDKENILDCSISASISSPPDLYMLAENVRATIRAYQDVLPDAEIVFLTDTDCRKALNDLKPELLEYFDNLEGMFKGDICRVADLLVNGGYYFDVDLLIVNPFVAPPGVEFATVKAWKYESNPQLFQAFVATKPGNHIIARSLTIMLEVLKGERKMRGILLGTFALQEALAEIEFEENSSNVNSKVYLLSELLLDEQEDAYGKLPRQPNDGSPGYTEGTCNYFVADDVDQSVYFYSRVVGTTLCGKEVPLQGVTTQVDQA